MKEEVLNPFQIVRELLKDAIDELGLEPAVYELLKQPMRYHEASFPVKMDDGSIKVFTGYRALHNDALGPTKGGLRFHPDAFADEVKALSTWMTLKCAILGLPYGGGKGAVTCNPKELSKAEVERVTRAFMQAMADVMGPETDIPAPDVYTNPQIMAWLVDEYSKIRRFNAFGVMTGKPLVIGGSLGRNEATARGCVICVAEAAARKGMTVEGATAAVQGYGNAGSVAAALMHERRAKVVAVSDSRGGIYNKDGIDPAAALAFKNETGSVVGLAGCEEISNDELLTLDVDVLIPAAMENQITSANAAKVRAKIVSEAANGPTTPEADSIMWNNNVFVIPDVLASAGGVTVSYFEWVQNNMGYYWSEDEVNGRLKVAMEKAFGEVYDMHVQYNTRMRRAAYMLAISRVAEAMKVRGWI